MRNNHQISKLYLFSVLQQISLTGAWVALLTVRGFTLVEIGFVETVFHITSLIFEIPSGVFADVFGRRNTLILSTVMGMIGAFLMIKSTNLTMVCLSIVFQALLYNFSSGSGDALAYDSLKALGQASYYDKFLSNQMIIYRVGSGLSTLCAGVALFVGYKSAYATDLVMGVVLILVLLTIKETNPSSIRSKGFLRLVKQAVTDCFHKSFQFLLKERRTMILMFCNSFVGAIDILLLFFLQAKLPQAGVTGIWLGISLFIMEMGGVTGSRLILHLKKIPYRSLFFATTTLVLTGCLFEHSSYAWLMVAGGFLAAVADDALQLRTNQRLQDMFPSEQRATLGSIESFTFSIIMLVLSPLAGFFFTVW